jgi:hexosaminidase
LLSQWGTFPPQSNYTNNIDTDVSIQHWEYFEDNPYYDYILNNYSVVNSDDRVYVVQKYSASYPQQLNQTFIFEGNPEGGAWSPYIFDSTNSSNNPLRDNPYVLGHIAPQWNDYGANASTYLEAYYSWRDGLPALTDKQWGGNISRADYNNIFELLQASAPAQNLDRTIKSASSTILEYNFNKSSTTFTAKDRNGTIKDTSGNGYDGTTNCSTTSSALQVRDACSLTTPLRSKGEDYTLSFSVKPSSPARGPIFTGQDSVLQSSSSSLDLLSGGYAYALNYSLPIDEWTQAKLVRSGNRTFFTAGDQPAMEFLIRVGVNGERFERASMALNAPVEKIGGGSWEGEVGEMRLLDYAS